MTSRTRFAIVIVALAMIAGCDRDMESEKGVGIKKESMVKQNPDATRPEVTFPSSLHPEDPTVKVFVEEALGYCAQGRYDDFRQVFGTQYTPTSYDDFKLLWGQVKELRVKNLAQEPPKYYLHLVMTYRRQDSKGRTEREAVVMIFREGDHWRIGPAPKALIGRFAETQPESKTGTKSPAPRE